MLHLFFSLFRFFLHRRYSINLKNIELLDCKDPLVLMPNHPALVDPMIMVSHTAQHKIFSPIMTETYFHTPGLGPIVRALSAVPVGDLARGGSIDDVSSAFASMIDALDAKKSLLLYPSGHIYVQGFEHIIGKKMAYELISRVNPTQRIILARTRGLWGSIWSKAYTGNSPDIFSVLARSVWYILANAVFFVPKRAVTIEFVDKTDDLHTWYKQGIDVFNKNLQNFYNEEGEEGCRFIQHYFYYNDVANKVEPDAIEGSVRALEKGSSISISDIPEDIYAGVLGVVSEVKSIDSSKLKYNTNLILDLHADSLDMAEIKSRVQSLYTTASNPPIGKIITIGDLAVMAVGKLNGESVLPPIVWKEMDKKGIEYAHQESDTILSKMIENFGKYPDDVFIYDALIGSMDRKTFLLRSYVVGEYIRGLSGDNLGIMMPALASTSLLLCGAYLGNKIPVMLNWTIGERSFAHCMDFAGIEMILTSRKFYEKIQTPWLKNYEAKMIFVEDIVRDISWSMKLKAVIKKTLRIIPQISDTAVILFTSGSESLPKAVRLTHKNILSDIAGALELVDFSSGEIFMGILPPFHSFGFTINTICPLIFPLRAVYSPDPSDAKTVAELIRHTGATVLAGTPTFLRMILSAGDVATFSSLHIAIAGAEKCGQDVFDLVQEKTQNAYLLEGYGITECSPIVTVNPTSKQKQGSAGKFLPSLSYSIRNLDGSGDVAPMEQGMLYISGPSIFEGYLDLAIESPFEEWDNKKWYKTGDLGYIDDEGYLFITGRLKRFVKIAGEMISLPFIESILLERYGNRESVSLAIEAKEEDGKVTLVAFTIFDTTTEELNNYIHAHGASNLVKIARVERLELIPVLGTGKTDYKLLKSMI